MYGLGVGIHIYVLLTYIHLVYLGKKYDVIASFKMEISFIAVYHEFC